MQVTIELREAAGSGRKGEKASIDTDVLVVGGGPHGLAVAARILREQVTGLRYDTLSDAHRAALASARTSLLPSQPLSVRVLDEHGSWISAWKSNFAVMGIPYLRSRVTAHPDPSDVYALLDFAMSKGRENELQHHCRTHLPGGPRSRRGQRIDQESLGTLHDFARPTAALFSDFCDSLAASLGKEEVIEGKALGIRCNTDGSYCVSCSTCEVRAGAVVLACGGLGRPRVPQWAIPIPTACSLPRLPTVVHTQELCSVSGQSLSTLGGHAHAPVVVVGAGMSGCWLALALARTGRPVTIVARSGLRVQDYDTSHDWWGRTGNRKLCEFYSCDAEERAELVHKARGGGHGTVTPELCARVREAIASGQLDLVEHEPVSGLYQEGLLLQSGRHLRAEAVLLATGVDADCMASDLFVQAMKVAGGVKVHHGLPALRDDLRLHADHQIFISGALAALGAGPHAHNLQGARTCSRLIVDALLHERDDCVQEVFDSQVLSNRYAALLADEDGSNDDNSDDDTENEE